MVPGKLDPTAEQGPEPAWHTLTPEQALTLLDASEQGLDGEEAAARLRRYGMNRPPEARRAGWPSLFLKQFKNPLIYVLLVAAAISAAIGELGDAAFIMVVLLINAVVGTVQEYKAETSAQALRHIMQVSARVLRNGHRHLIDGAELVPGDVVLLEAGDAVPADIRLLAAKELQADESLLTGESLPVDKDARALLQDPDAPLGDRTNLLHAATHVIEGRAMGVVCRTGRHTEVGRIAASLSATAAPPPLVLRLRRFTFVIAVVTLLFIVALAAGQLLRGAGLIDTFFFAIALAVSAIPEGLPVAITVALAIASHRMAARNVIVRLLPAVEGLGTCTLIASDKTGTLTANKLTIRRLHLADGYEVDIGGEGFEPRGDLSHQGALLEPLHVDDVTRLAVTATLCNEGEFWSDDEGVHYNGDTVDVAFLVFAAKLGIAQQDLTRAHPQLGFIPFQAARRYAASFNRHEDVARVHVKGAAEVILPMCRDIDGDGVQALLDGLTTGGYRVLALASGDVPLEQAEHGDPHALNDLSFLGFAGLIDPVREQVPDALAKCRKAGIQVAMVTGDHPVTALAIARQLGIASGEDEVMTGGRLRELEADPAALADTIKHMRVFARVEPAHKTLIVKAFQRAGHFVAVTGDGVNDAPALRAANIGVAMGRSGTDVARQAADLILTDDNFASIVNGVEEGRVAYDNVRKVTWLLISTGASEILLFFLAFLFQLPLPMDAVQLLWLNLVTNGVQDVALAFERGEPGVLDRPPRPTRQPIFDRRMIQQTLLSGIYIGIAAFLVFEWLMAHPDWSPAQAHNLLLLTMVLFENAQALNCRSERRSVFRVPFRANRLLILSIVAAHGIHILAMYTPGLSGLLGVQPVSLGTWVILLLLAATLVGVVEAYKHLQREG